MNLLSGNLLGCISVFLFSLVISFDALAVDSSSVNQNLWKNLGEQTEINRVVAGKPTTMPLLTRLLELDEVAFKSLLNESTSQNQNSVTASTKISILNNISLPLPDGSQVNVKITPSKVMSDALAQQFPEIKTWKVTGVSDDITGTIDFTHLGFHAMLLMPEGDTIFIGPNNFDASGSPAKKVFSEKGRYLSFSKGSNKENFKSEFSCGVHSDSPLNYNTAAKSSLATTLASSGKLQSRPSSDLITYRLAVATTGEYTQFHGGSVSSALSAIVTTIARVNEIYERDLSVKFQLIAEQSELIYLNPNTDPYTNNDSNALVSENRQNLSSNGILSTAKYDIGHVFGTGGGGLANFESTCNNSFKAGGATGLASPIGDAFDVEFVAHELGHQMGASHTFNSACNGGSERQGFSAVEPGSGTTIMSYAGICQENNIQFNADDYFHVFSIAQIRKFSREDDGSGCGVLTSTANENPTVSGTNDFTVPARTPVVFNANGADTDGDALSYTWEQSDVGSISDVNVDTGNNALFRSRPPGSFGTRFIPRLSDLFNSTTSRGELLPITNRSMEMVVTVRDGKGGLQSDLVNMNVFDTGESFSVTSHTTNQNIERGNQHTIRWNVAGTDVSPISCANVDIGLATASGVGIDIITTPNDGQQQITIPSDTPSMSNARFIVSCNSSGFFNISSGRLSLGDTTNVDSENGGGGGTISVFILFLFSILLWRRNYY